MATFYSPKTVTDNLIFYYDVDNVKSYAGEPTTNTNGFGQYNYWWGNAIVGRNVAGPSIPPPITGYEIASLMSTDGQDTQTILYTASVDQVNGGVYTHSAYVYLVSGTWATVGQHWNPWDYGVQNYIPKGQWTRISYTLTNSSNNYGAVALSYNTNGMIYITAPQYEKKSHSTPFVYGTRSNTQGLLDLSPTNQTISLSAAGYDSGGMISFDGSSNYINAGSVNLQQNFTLECWAYITGDNSGLFGQGATAQSQGLHVLWYYQGNRGMIFGMYGNDLDTPGYTLTYNTWHHFVFTYNHSTYLKQFYADGRLQNSNTGTNYTGSGQFNIGACFSSASVPAKGKINIAKVYNKVLTASEVLQNFNATKGRFGL